FGLSAVKGVGEKAVEAIAQARRDVGKFKDLWHFCRTVDLRTVNRTTMDALIKCGAFDTISGGPEHRAAMAAGLEKAISAGQKHASDRRVGQTVLFEQGGDTGEEIARLPDVPPWSRDEMLTNEKETLGFYVSSHPLEHVKNISDGLNWPRGFTIAQVPKQPDYGPVAACCSIAQMRITLAKRGKSAGKKMGILTLEDLTGKCDAFLFSENFDKYGQIVKGDAILFVTGSVSRRTDKPTISIDTIETLADAIKRATEKVIVRCKGHSDDATWLGRLRGVIERHRGDCELNIVLCPAGQPKAAVRIKANRKWSVNPTLALLQEVGELAGQENVVPVARESAAKKVYKPRYGNGGGGRD
ncbi:MAG: OB-fold nucleic acid binding domain-containing protein, partial [bacterium]